MSDEQPTNKGFYVEALYAEAAYRFVLDGVLSSVANCAHTRSEHIAPAELVRILVTMAKERYGAYARGVFHGWGIHTSTDIGNIVYQLAKGNCLDVSEDDVPEAFANAGDLDKELASPFETEGPYPDMPIII